MNRENHIEKDIKGMNLWIQREGVFGESYEEAILHKQQIPGLIPFYEIENMGEAYLVYMLSFRKNFVQKLEGGRMGCVQMESFLKSLIQMLHMMDEYLLNPSNLVLEMNCIYENEEKWSYLYVPGYNEDFWHQMEKFSEEWLNYVDYGDEKAVLWAYSFYEKVHGNGCSIEDLAGITKLEKAMMGESTDCEATIYTINENDGYVAKKEQKHWWQIFKEKISLKKWNKRKENEEVSDFFKKENSLEDTCPMLDLPEIDDQEKGKVLILIPMGEVEEPVIRIERIPALIGRASDEVDIWLKDLKISRIHARLDYLYGKMVVVDMNSINGTFRNGERLQSGEPYELYAGDIIKLADLEFICQWCS